MTTRSTSTSPSASATSNIARDQMPDLARPAYDLCEQFGFFPKFTFEYPTPPDLRKRVQVRTEKHVAPPMEVRKYAASMKNGEKFPPIIITEDGYVVDGSTRAGGARKNRFPHVQALVLDAKHEGASEKDMERLIGLGAAFNLRNGKGIDRAETRKAIERLGKNPNYNATRIAALLGCTETTVLAIMSEKRARDRAEKLGIFLNGDLSASVMRTLGRSEKTINDEPLTALLRLTLDACLTQKEIVALIKAMREAKSDEGALEVLRIEREARRDQIGEHRATGGRTKPPFASQLRQHLGFILRFEANAKDLVEHSPNLREEHLQRVEKAAGILQKVIEKQAMLNAAAV